MTRFVTQQEPLISLSDHRASSHAREHEDQARRTQLRKPITSVPLTGTGAASTLTSIAFFCSGTNGLKFTKVYVAVNFFVSGNICFSFVFGYDNVC